MKDEREDGGEHKKNNPLLRISSRSEWSFVGVFCLLFVALHCGSTAAGSMRQRARAAPKRARSVGRLLGANCARLAPLLFCHPIATKGQRSAVIITQQARAKPQPNGGAAQTSFWRQWDGEGLSCLACSSPRAASRQGDEESRKKVVPFAW